MIDSTSTPNGNSPAQVFPAPRPIHLVRRTSGPDILLQEEKDKALRRLQANEWAREELAKIKAKNRPKIMDTILSIDDLDELPEVLPLIDGVMPQGGYGILNGRDSTFKSFTALDMALCAVTERPWKGHAITMPEDRPCVLYIAAEGSNGYVPRIRAWEEEHGVKVADYRSKVPAPGSPNYETNPRGQARFFLKYTAANLFMGGDADDLVNMLKVHASIGLVIVDTLRRSSGGADQNGSDMGVVIDNIQRIKEAMEGGTVLVIAHTNKDDNDTRGSSLIEDDADFVWHSKVSRGIVTLENTKMKDMATHDPIKLRTKVVGPSLVMEAIELDPFADPAGTDRTTDALVIDAVALIDAAGQEATRSAILRAVRDQVQEGDKAPSESTVIRALGNCLKAGTLVQERKKGPYTLPE